MKIIDAGCVAPAASKAETALPMKHLVAAFFVTSSIAIAIASAAETTQEIADARQRYDSAVAFATKPIRDRYVLELQQLKRRAMSPGDLTAANNVDAEIKRLTGDSAIAGAAPAAGVPETVTDWERRLIGTSWIWNKRVDCKFTFGENNSVTPTFSYMKWKVTAPATVEYSFDNGNHGTIVFEKTLNRGVIHEIHGDSQRVEMTLVRAKD